DRNAARPVRGSHRPSNRRRIPGPRHGQRPHLQRGAVHPGTDPDRGRVPRRRPAAADHTAETTVAAVLHHREPHGDGVGNPLPRPAWPERSGNPEGNRPLLSRPAVLAELARELVVAVPDPLSRWTVPSTKTLIPKVLR